MRHLRTVATTLSLAALVVLLHTAGAAADTGATAASGPRAAEPVAAAAAPALTLKATPPDVSAGDHARLVVGLGIPGATLSLTRRRAGDPAPVPLATLVAGADGTVEYGVRPPVTTTYRVEYQGDGQQWLPAAAEATVSVRPLVALSAGGRVYRGGRVRLGVSVRPAMPGGAVVLQLRQGGAWTDWRTIRLGAGSSAGTTWRPGAAGRFALRAVSTAGPEYAEANSPVRRVEVLRPNPYGVPIDVKGIIVVDISEYRLRFFSRGVELRSFPCVTGRPGLPTPIGHFSVYARGVWPGGPYGARIMSYHPPCAIHGTNEPWLLKKFPRNFSHGCTRLSNANAVWLYDHAPLGTPVWNVR
jgi:lipoprotein-anchoring transpeptidase ErfK/SrfK